MRSSFSNSVDVVAGARELLRARQAGGAGADDRDALAGLARRRLRRDPAFLPALVDDGVLDRLDADRIVVDAEHARRLARRGTDAAGELGELLVECSTSSASLPVLPVDQVVPVRNDVVDRAAGLAERDAAIHAARALLRRRVVVERDG